MTALRELRPPVAAASSGYREASTSGRPRICAFRRQVLRYVAARACIPGATGRAQRGLGAASGWLDWRDVDVMAWVGCRAVIDVSVAGERGR